MVCEEYISVIECNLPMMVDTNKLTKGLDIFCCKIIFFLPHQD